MLTVQRNFSLPAFPEQDTKTLYFDIETTGLSARTSGLYLIGCCFFDGTGWQLIQWFAESMADECGLLRAFFDLLGHFSRLVHYNGTAFDIPYLKNCARPYRLNCPFSNVSDLDLFRTARHLGRIIRLSDYRQKTVEAFFQLPREDCKSGGELIEQYQTYLQTGQETLLTELFLHNDCDVTNLPRLHAALTSYEGLAQADYLLSKQEDENGLTLTLTFPGFSFPQPADPDVPYGRFHLEDDRITAFLPFFCGELRHFFPDYRDYYYIPEEDTAMHRKVAQFVEPARRRRATASTCYIRRTGTFLEQPSAVLVPDFTEEYRGKRHYFLYRAGQTTDEELRRFLSSLLSCLYPAPRA